jgi:hypothetical protein
MKIPCVYMLANRFRGAVYVGVIHALPPPNRHHNIVHALGYAGIDLVGREEQGFLLSDGSFADRPQALVIARAAGQVLRETGPHIGLFSEDVW